MSKLVEQDPLHTVEGVDDAAQPPASAENDAPQIITPDAARQGPLGAPVLMMLLGGLALIFIGLLVVLMLSGTPPPSH